MANLIPTPGWDDVLQLETNTPVLGGPGGVANAQAQSLLNRLEYLVNYGVKFNGSTVRMEPGAFTSFVAFRSTTTSDASRVYIVPNGAVPGVTAALKIFMDDYQAVALTASADYRDFGIYADKSIKGPNGAGSFLLNSKSNNNYFAHMPQIGFSRSDGSEINLRVATMYTGATEAQMSSYAANYAGAWAAGLVVPAGATISAGVYSYSTTAGGTCGATKPTHTSGTFSDGGVSWTYLWDNSTGGTGSAIRQYVLVGNKDDTPIWSGATRIKDAILHLLRDFVLYPTRRLLMIKSSGVISAMFGVRDGSTDDVWLADSTDTYGMRWNFTSGSPFVQTVNMAYCSSAKVISDLSTTPNVGGCQKVIFNNGSTTAVVQMPGQPAHGRLVVTSGNGNTTLVHNGTPGSSGSPTIATNTNGNKTLTTGSCLEFHLNSSQTQWIEVGRL